jgi:iron(III) transport system substrate-binding protein
VRFGNAMASGEVPLSPTTFDSNVFVVKRTGAPVEWRPIDPVVANVGYSGIVARAPHPHTALLSSITFIPKKDSSSLSKADSAHPETTLSLWYRKNSKKPI